MARETTADVLDDVADNWPDTPNAWFHYAERYETSRLTLVALNTAGYEVVRRADEMTVDGHKVFVAERDGSAWIEMVNDDRPLVRMTLELLADEARDIARSLDEAAAAAEVSD